MATRSSSGRLPLVGEFFAPDGALSRAGSMKMEPRPSQYKMALAVERALTEESPLVVEAGTGTGKTMAYLFPALREAMLYDKRIIVSTGTKNLQEQIYFKDVPMLQRVVPDFKVVYLKGRSNYLCRQKVHDLRRYGMPGEELREHDVILQWEKNTSTGDRSELTNLPESSSLWRRIDARSETCTGKKCPKYDDCFVTLARAEAENAHLIIVNHHLLLTDVVVKMKNPKAGILPSADAVIFDEAHELEGVASDAFGLTLSNRRIADLIADIRKMPGHTKADSRLLNDLPMLQQRFDMLCSVLPVQQRAERVCFEDRPGFLRVYGETYDGVLSALQQIHNHLAGMRGEDEAELLAERTKTVRAELRYLIESDDASSVVWIERRPAIGGSFNTHISATPIDVSEALRVSLYDQYSSVIFCSATLAVQNSLAHTRKTLGVDDGNDMILPSTFDYAKQAVLYLPPDMPDPRDETFFERAKEITLSLLEVSQGRAFCLFTSYEAMMRMYRALENNVRFPLLLHGTLPRKTLLDRFRKEPGAVLLGTSSFWQGIDVQGEKLSCVIIDRLPFAVPNDPIVMARTKAIEAGGGNGFFDYQIPKAVIALNQGFGRLIRSIHDQGILSILDPRIRHPRYGKVFLESLPPYTVTSDIEVTKQFVTPPRFKRAQ